jgi:hypothetical protein
MHNMAPAAAGAAAMVAGRPRRPPVHDYTAYLHDHDVNGEGSREGAARVGVHGKEDCAGLPGRGQA